MRIWIRAVRPNRLTALSSFSPFDAFSTKPRSLAGTRTWPTRISLSREEDESLVGEVVMAGSGDLWLRIVSCLTTVDEDFGDELEKLVHKTQFNWTDRLEEFFLWLWPLFRAGIVQELPAKYSLHLLHLLHLLHFCLHQYYFFLNAVCKTIRRSSFLFVEDPSEAWRFNERKQTILQLWRFFNISRSRINVILIFTDLSVHFHFKYQDYLFFLFQEKHLVTWIPKRRACERTFRGGRCSRRREMIARVSQGGHTRNRWMKHVGLESVGILLFPSVFQRGVLWIQIDAAVLWLHVREYAGSPVPSAAKSSRIAGHVRSLFFPVPQGGARNRKNFIILPSNAEVLRFGGGPRSEFRFVKQVVRWFIDFFFFSLTISLIFSDEMSQN